MIPILVVEDNDRLRGLMAAALRRAGYDALEAEHGEAALAVMDRASVSLAIVDLMMPVMDGHTLIETLRETKHTLPILIITARDALEDKRRGFLGGADDYMVKPIDMEEMILRVEALLRRAQIAGSHKLVVGKTTLNEDSLAVLRGDDVTLLPRKEFFLLQKLLSYPGKIFTRQALMDEIWGYDTDSDLRTVDVHIRRLREKFDGCPDFTLETVRGLGYRAVAS